MGLKCWTLKTLYQCPEFSHIQTYQRSGFFCDAVYKDKAESKWSKQIREKLISRMWHLSGCCEGLLAIYYTKERYGRPHLSTPHSMLGAVTVCYVLIQTCAGINLLYPQIIGKFADVRAVSRIHGLSGTFLLLLATLTLLGGVNTEWFHERVTGPVWYVCVACPLAIYSLVAIEVLSSKSKTS